MVTGEEMHQIDRYTIEEIGLKAELLMENAGLAFVSSILHLMNKKTAKIAVLIGVGNNGGDGFVISRSLLEKGYQVDVWLIPPVKKVKGTARYHMEVFKKCGYEFTSYEAITCEDLVRNLKGKTHVIDAMLGTGLVGPLRQPYKEIIEQVNQLECQIISVDLPSGLPANGNSCITDAIKASRTITLQCPKLGAYTFPSREYYGDLTIVDIGIPKLAIKQIDSERFLWTEENVACSLPVRKPSSHKGSHGKGLIIAGSRTMTGAPILTAKACHRLGAGLVTLALPDTIINTVASQLIESTFHLCPSVNGEINSLNLDDELMNRFDAIAVGPGLGRNNNGEFIETLLHDFDKPIVIDADGLFYLKDFLTILAKRKGTTILTPHLGEFAYLINEPIAKVEKNRFQVSRDFAVKYGVYLVLKGPYTVVTTPGGQQFINTSGNPSLAKGGSGDVLTGMVLALLMQQKDLQSAISNSIFLHGMAADYLISHEYSPLSVMASDLINIMPKVLNSIQNRYHKYR
ncbi:NAD(P)H-hydrate dehydratase [Anaerobacillus alkalilacustris]|uniref:NAD(P)H-hydrate dehydratase n=1 Tax=Anaerobacillus alkalilacustris TaxID=393763 RepID=UPI001FE17EF8|nr:NAD(P)H-hydrate dehydratase [Anaerobacillus alkalilacustris]